jgi:hypothetical protein
MLENEPTPIKQREICFQTPHPDPQQAESALWIVKGVDGIVEANQINDRSITIRYDLRRINLQLIEATLAELGFHLEMSLIAKLKRALYYYTEETECANRGCHSSRDDAREIFIQRYQQRPHGCRDHRPDYWRDYL